MGRNTITAEAFEPDASAWRLRFFAGVVDRLVLSAKQITVGLVGILAWYLIDRAQLVPSMISRSPQQVAEFLWQIAKDGTLWPSLYSTLEATLVAFILASAAGIVAGILLGIFPKVEALLDPYLNALNAMPRIAFGPVFIIAFGIGQTSKIALAFSIVFFIMLINARAGVRTVDRDILTMARVMNCSKLQMFFKILLPSAVPSIFAGLRLGLIYSLLGVITSEIIASRVGLGQLIAWYSGVFQLEGVYAVVIVLAFVASILNMTMAVLEKKLLKGRALD